MHGSAVGDGGSLRALDLTLMFSSAWVREAREAALSPNALDSFVTAEFEGSPEAHIVEFVRMLIPVDHQEDSDDQKNDLGRLVPFQDEDHLGLCFREPDARC